MTRSLLFFGLSLAVCVACSRPRTGTHLSEPPAQIDVRPQSVILRAGGSQQMVAQVNDTAGRPIGGAEIRFATSDPAMAGVTASGLVASTGKTGAARIIVSSGGRSATAEILIVPGPPDRLESVAGDGQTGQVGSALSARLSVRVADAYGNAVEGTPVRFEASDKGKLDPPEASTAADGSASTVWILGFRAGRQSVTATSGRVIASFQAMATPAEAAHLVKVGSEPERPVAGAILPVQVLVTDVHGNAKPRTAVLWKAMDGRGRVDPETSATDASGIGQARWTIDERAGRSVLSASVANVPEASAKFVIDAVAGPPARLLGVAGERQSGRAGRLARVPPAVRVLDAHGNPVSGVLVHFRVTAGGGVVAPTTVPTDVSGTARTVSWELGGPGTNTVEAVVEVEGLQASTTFSARARR